MSIVQQAAGKKKLLGAAVADLEFAPALYAKFEKKCDDIENVDEHNIIFFTQRYKFADVAKGPSDPAVEEAFVKAVTAHNDLAMEFLSRGNAKKCRMLLKESQKLLRERPNDVLHIKTLNNMAVLNKHKQKAPEALDLLRKAAKIGKRGAKSRARAKMEVGGDSVETAAHLAPHDIASQSLAPGMALTELNTCAVLSHMGRHSEAVGHAFEAIRHCEKGLAEESHDGHRHRRQSARKGFKDERGELTQTMAIALHNCAVELEHLALRGAQSSKRSVQQGARPLWAGHSRTADGEQREGENARHDHQRDAVDPLINQAVEFYHRALKIAQENFPDNATLISSFRTSHKGAVANQRKNAARKEKRPSTGMRRPSSAPPGRQGKARIVQGTQRSDRAPRPRTSGAPSHADTREVYTPSTTRGGAGSRGISASSSTSAASHSSASSSSSFSTSSVAAATSAASRYVSSRFTSNPNKEFRKRRPQSAKPFQGSKSAHATRRFDRRRPRSASRRKALEGRPPFDLRTENVRPQSATTLMVGPCSM